MENIILVVHLLLALALIAVVLLQRSEGGGLGMGGSGGGSMAGRPPANPMTKVTWGFAIAFLTTSIILTILAAQQSASSSVIDALPLEDGQPLVPSVTDALPDAGALLPPTTSDSPLTPPRAE